MPADPATRLRFSYSSYWGTWSLLLTDRCRATPGSGPSVEISLEPVNGWERGDVADTLSVRVRRHGTARRPRDVVAASLPEEREARMREHWPAELFAWLMDPRTEILGIIDWESHQAGSYGGGGCPLAACLKPEFAHLMPATLSIPIATAA